jgi:hypothetical protein
MASLREDLRPDPVDDIIHASDAALLHYPPEYWSDKEVVDCMASECAEGPGRAWSLWRMDRQRRTGGGLGGSSIIEERQAADSYTALRPAKPAPVRPIALASPIPRPTGIIRQ